MINIFHIVPNDIDYAIIIQGSSIEFGTNWEFEYTDITAEFQFLIIKLLKYKNRINIEKISHIFGLPENIVKNLIKYMCEANLVKSKQGEIFELTSKGSSITTSEKIIEKEYVFFVSEVCTTSQTFMGQSYSYIDKVNEKTSSLNIDVDTLNNKPENSTSIDKFGYIINNYKTHIIISKDHPVRIISETGRNCSIPKDDYNNKIREFKNQFESLISSKDWITTCKLNYERIKFHQINEVTIAVETNSFDMINVHLSVINNNQVLLYLMSDENKNVSYVKKINVVGYDNRSAILILLKIMISKSREFWDELSSDLTALSKIWKSCIGNNNFNLPNINELIDIALENNLYQVVRYLREKEDIYAETY